MALTIGQIAAASYPAVLNEKRKPANQWADHAFMNELERLGAIKKVSLGETIQATLDYRRNQGADFLATDMTETSLAKTEVLTAADYAIAELSIPVNWSKGDDAKNPTENQKVSFVKALLENAIETHDDMIEEALFESSTDGFLGLQTIIGDAGTETVGGISGSTETWWRNGTGTYQSDGSDIEAQLQTLWNTLTRGSGSQLSPTMIVSGAAAQAIFESTQTALQRFNDTQELKAGFKVLGYKTARWSFSQYGGTRIYMANAKSLNLVVSKQYFRDKGEQQEHQDANAFNFKIYSALQLITNNRSRLGVLTQA